jgi:hypothetical protein
VKESQKYGIQSRVNSHLTLSIYFPILADATLVAGGRGVESKQNGFREVPVLLHMTVVEHKMEVYKLKTKFEILVLLPLYFSTS